MPPEDALSDTTSKLPSSAGELPATHPQQVPPVGRTWIVIGTFAVLVGLAMGFIMSSLGK